MEDMDRPVFSRGGYMVYIYGYGYTFFDPFHGERRVIEYSLWFTGTAKNKSCFFRFYNQRTMYCFSHLLNFPLLMKAFFKSTDKHEYIDEGELLRVYALSGVTIPDNYTVYKTCSLANYGNYGSYDELGYGIKKTLDMRYKEQQREQKKT
jgi:hypothetical protein